MKFKSEERCPICHGYKSKSTTTFTVDLKFGMVVIRVGEIDIDKLRVFQSGYISLNPHQQVFV